MWGVRWLLLLLLLGELLVWRVHGPSIRRALLLPIGIVRRVLGILRRHRRGRRNLLLLISRRRRRGVHLVGLRLRLELAGVGRGLGLLLLLRLLLLLAQ